MPAVPIRPASGSWNRFAGDAWGGFAAMLVVLPSAIAYGVTVYALLGAAGVGLGVRAGLIGAVALGLVAATFGGTPRLISTPSAPAAAVLAALVIELLRGQGVADNPAAATPLVGWLALVTLMCGLLQCGFGLLGGGRLIKYLPYPVTSGYLSGVGVLIFLSQVPNFFGWPQGVPLRVGLHSPQLWQWPPAVVGAVTLIVMVFAPRLTRAVPATILGLLAGMGVYFGLGLLRPDLLQVEHNPLVLGTVGGGAGALFAAPAATWAALRAIRPADVAMLVGPALTLSVLLSIDTLKSCVVVDTLTRTRHRSNRELLAQGAGNLVCAAVGGMPGSGMMGATLVNLNSGGRTRLSGVLEGAFVLAAVLLLGRWIAWVPLAGLAGILSVVAFRMFDWESLHLLRHRATWLDFGVIAAVVIAAIATNLIAATAVGLGLAILLFIREQIRGSVIHRKTTGDRMSSTQRRRPEEAAVLRAQGAQTTICELQGSLFFGTTDRLFTDLDSELRQCRYLILDLRRLHSVDYTAAHLLAQFEAMVLERGGHLVFSRLPAGLPTGRNLATYFSQVGVTGARRNVRRFDTLDDALLWVEDRILDEALPDRERGERPLELAQFELLREFESGQTHAPLEPLAACVVERSCGPGETIFRAGDEGDELFLIRRGHVRLVLPVNGSDHHNLAACGRGDFFGEVAFLDRGGRSADAVATTPTDLYVISRARFDAVSRAHPVVGVKMFARLARVLALRLRHADGELRAWYEA